MAMAGAAPLGGARQRVLFQGDRRSEAALVLFIWAVFAVITGYVGYAAAIEGMSTDDAMRLVEARDFLAGQGWYDLLQRRLNPPDGVFMHWSRLIDLPIALLLGAFDRVAAADAALRLTVTVWPALPLLPALFAVASLTRSLGGAGVLGAFLFVMSPGPMSRFAPGMIDHHGPQLALALIMLACALRLDRSAKAAAGAGLAGAAMLAIGMETLPTVAVIAAAIALRWAVTGPEVARGTAAFGAVFALATLAAFLIDVAPERWLLPVCDALGPAHLGAAVVGGSGLALATRSPGDGAAARFAGLALIGVMVVLVVAFVAPACLGDPYAALPEIVRTEWLEQVSEARGALTFAHDEPQSALVIATLALSGVGAALWLSLRCAGGARWRVWTGTAVLVVSCLVACWQVRGATFALAFAIPFLAACITALARSGGPLRGALGLVALNHTTLAVLGLGAAAALGFPAKPSASMAARLCPVADYRALNALTPGLALNNIDSGPHILAFSRLSAVAAPYHRDVDGIAAQIEMMTGSEETARAVALSRRAAYVVLCPGNPGVRAERERNPTGFVAKALGPTPPAWLTPIDLPRGTTLRAFRVSP
ncbi:hypothetical protein [Methylopila sp. Yamaguchi]|uniref:hypothetical protein n=1 Tax=Methylopila sp. Yamaguchi TaxID=1437817 RepID=UPI000CA6D849|nr:hypothetical protein [Methylopila sp. Yamaguchi]GBD50690.1 hypothetical protein METY_3903 [Methylopila sp. Yamaguchi]